MTVTNTLYRLVYVSRSNQAGDEGRLEAEVERILAVSRHNNKRAGITGALLFSADVFAQTLEGDLPRVTETFERIQCDPRHRDTVVLQVGPIRERGFPDWSMAYAGRVEREELCLGHIVGPTDQAQRTTAALDILAVMQGIVLRAEQRDQAA